ncbi:hypothetical protein [Campylobacter sp. MG1]|uniref:hypothetical protein n=1 Tax=Campylobacter sp. MG1 TaxID=2976332 RepID=UPI00226C8A27|nr:hypothetical protein [Campylobacter sp. MG1]
MDLFKKDDDKFSILGASLFDFLELILYAAIIGFFVSAVFLSDYSLTTNAILENKIENVKKEIVELNRENAELQKAYFELLSIQGNYDN